MTVQHVSSPASSSAPRGLDAAANKEISAIWAQVQARVVQLAGGDSKNIKSNLSIEAVLIRLDQAQDGREQSSKVYSTIRSTFNITLQFIQTVGEIVAQGASEVRHSPLARKMKLAYMSMTRCLPLPSSVSTSSAS